MSARGSDRRGPGLRALRDDVLVAPYGTWPSPVTLDAVVAGAAVPGEVRINGNDVFWSESRPAEGGRIEVVCRSVEGTLVDVLGPRAIEPGRTWNARTALLEYGGGAFCADVGFLTFAQWDDQRLYGLVTDEDAPPVPLTPVPEVERGWRYGDLVPYDAIWVLAVRETHPGVGDWPASAPEPRHDIVAIPIDGSAATDPDEVVVLVQGPDFVASPRPGPGRLAWVEWDHPHMPWDETRLVVAPIGRDSEGRPALKAPGEVRLGGPGASVVEPMWDGEGRLWCCSDESGWWNLVRPALDGPITVDEPAVMEAEVGGPRWVAGLRPYACLGDGTVLAAATSEGATGLVAVSPAGSVAAVPLALDGAPVSHVAQVVAGPGPSQAVVLAASATSGLEPALVDLDPRVGGRPSDGGRRRRSLPGVDGAKPLRPRRELPLPLEAVARPEPITFPSAGGRVAHAQLYRPRSATHVGPIDERPPVVVMIHGGPTSAARPMLDLSRQLWTSRGIAVVDVDYGGSTGYGRPYRRLLDRAWGVVDVEDCVAAVAHLAAEGIVDPDRAVIRGGSAGGFTALLAVCRSDAFAAATSLYGVTDLAALARDTHKFESRYLDGLVGPWPEAAEEYAARSPLAALDDLASPVLVLQGGRDAVVPPDQAEAVVAAAAAKGLPHAYVLFPDEGHGFRDAATIVTALGTELAFYGQVCGFTPADELPSLPATATAASGTGPD